MSWNSMPNNQYVADIINSVNHLSFHGNCSSLSVQAYPFYTFKKRPLELTVAIKLVSPSNLSLYV